MFGPHRVVDDELRLPRVDGALDALGALGGLLLLRLPAEDGAEALVRVLVEEARGDRVGVPPLLSAKAPRHHTLPRLVCAS